MGKLHHRLLGSLFAFISRNDPAAPPFDAQGVASILVVNTTAIGDTLLSTPAIRAVRKGFPRARVTALVSAAAMSVLKGSPRVDFFITHPGKVGPCYLAKLPGLVKRLRSGRFDLVVVLNANDPDAGPLAYITGAPHRVGWAESGFSFLFTVPVKTREPGTHYIDLRLRTACAAGVEPDGRGLEMFLGQEDMKEALAALPQAGARGLIAVHPFGSRATKWWPGENLRGFAALASSEGYGVVVLGAGTEAARAEEMVRGTEAVSVAGRLTVRGSAALISRCALLVTTDSGPMHISQALGVPTVALFGPDSPVASGPVNCGDIVLQKDLPCVPCRKRECPLPRVECMAAITPEEVMEAVRKRLS